MGIYTLQHKTNKEMDRMERIDKMLKSDSLISFFGEEEMFNAHTSVTSDDIWKKFDLLTPPLSPRRDGTDELDLENVTMPFDLDTEDLMEFDEEVLAEAMKLTFPESPPGDDGLKANLIQDIMWSAPPRIEDMGKEGKSRRRCDSCSSGSFNAAASAACVAPEDVFPYETNMAGPVLQQPRSRLHGLETPSDSEEEIDVVTVEKQYQVTVPGKRKYQDIRNDHSGTKTVTLTIERKPVISSQTMKRCPTVLQKVDCPTDVHNYSLPVTSLKRVRSFPNSPLTHKSKKLKRDISIPSDLRKVAQKLAKSSVGGSGSSCSRSSSDSEDFGCESGKRTQHNVLERKRRTDLKNSFFHLRDSVPELEGQERAAKVVILRKASQYIHKLIDEQRRLDLESEQLKIKKEKLKRQLHRLRDY